MIKNTHLYNIVFSRDDYMEVLMKLENQILFIQLKRRKWFLI